ncbi:hypothetical protein Rs2_20835 [Raphanus sativus]|nr:hypothetical protein Rs2_20835 [Raphanus sativus]
MTTRRLSAAEKGKNPATDPYQAPRKGRIQIEEPESTYLTHKHSLTLIGKVTNPSAQKVWALIAFFTDHWKTERKPVGADLGQGMFQFQFELESDLISVQEKRPYHYLCWMVILQRWEPTTSPHFPCLIPLWIKVQGIHVHLWTEDTIRRLDKDIGIFEEADITSLVVRMRVQINGRLPLIKQSVIEYKGGNEVTAHFVYEKLERHCSVCNRLDHEVRDCLEAKARKKEALKMQAETAIHQTYDGSPEGHRANRGEDSRKPLYPEDRKTTGRNRESEDYYRSRRAPYSHGRNQRHDHFHPYKRHDRDISEDRGSHQLSSYYQRQRSPHYHNTEHHSRDLPNKPTNKTYSSHQNPDSPPSERNVRNQDFGTPGARVEERHPDSARSRAETTSADRGIPHQTPHSPAQLDAIDKAMGEVREYMKQYVECADPMESAARKVRMRQAEDAGEVEETTFQMIQGSLATPPTNTRLEVAPEVTPRIPATLRLEIAPEVTPRLPATLRLGPLLIGRKRILRPRRLHNRSENQAGLQERKNIQQVPRWMGKVKQLLRGERLLQKPSPTDESLVLPMLKLQNLLLEAKREEHVTLHSQPPT